MQPQLTQITTTGNPPARILCSRVHLVGVTCKVDHFERLFDTLDGHCQKVVIMGFHGRMGPEWWYRLLKNTKKLWHRHLLDSPHFVSQLELKLIRNGY